MGDGQCVARHLEALRLQPIVLMQKKLVGKVRSLALMGPPLLAVAHLCNEKGYYYAQQKKLHYKGKKTGLV